MGKLDDLHSPRTVYVGDYAQHVRRLALAEEIPAAEEGVFEVCLRENVFEVTVE